MSNLPNGIASSWVQQNLRRVSQLGAFSQLNHKIWGPSRSSQFANNNGEATNGRIGPSYNYGTDSNTGSGSGIVRITSVNGSCLRLTSRGDSDAGVEALYGGTSALTSINAIGYPVSTGKWAYFCRFNVQANMPTNLGMAMMGACTNNADTAGWSLGFLGSSIAGGSAGFYTGKIKNLAGTSTVQSTVPYGLNTWHTGLIFSDGARAGLSIDGENVQYFGTFRIPDSSILVPHLRLKPGAGSGVFSSTLYISQQVFCWDVY